MNWEKHSESNIKEYFFLYGQTVMSHEEEKKSTFQKVMDKLSLMGNENHRSGMTTVGNE